MKLEIYDGKQGEKVVRLRLREDVNSVSVIAVKEDGTVDGDLGCGNLLHFLPNGRIELCERVADNLGFDLDGDDRIMLIDDDA